MSINKDYRRLSAYTDQLMHDLSPDLFPKAAQKIQVQCFANDNRLCLNKSAHYDALVLIDVQKEFCDITDRRGNTDTENTCKRIASLVPQFRAAGLPVYSVYFSFDEIPLDEVDFHHYQYADTDIPIRKTRDSAFQGDGDPFDDILNENRHKRLLVMGFNATACVYRTVKDAQSLGFECTIISDCISNDGKTYSDMTETLQNFARNQGVKFVPSGFALDAISMSGAPPQKQRTSKKKRFVPRSI